MHVVDVSAAAWCLGLVQLIGLGSALFTRLSEGSSGQSLAQWLFFACLAVVGLGTMAALALGPGYWLPCATTLSLMILAVTCDFSRSRERSLNVLN